MPDNSPLPGRHIYLSFTQEDDGTAAEIARALERRGIAVRLDRADIAWGESWADHLRSAVEQADTFVLVVSQDSSRHVHDWAQAAEALDRRGIDVVAVAVPPPAIRDLAGRPVLEYAGPSAGVRGMSVRRHRMRRQPEEVGGSGYDRRREHPGVGTRTQGRTPWPRIMQTWTGWQLQRKIASPSPGSGRQPQTSFHRSQLNVPCPCGQPDATWWPPSLQSHNSLARSWRLAL
jgi:hypothetical protein